MRGKSEEEGGGEMSQMMRGANGGGKGPKEKENLNESYE